MALTGKTQDYTDSLIQAGPDAFTNLYYLRFTGGKVGEVNTRLKVRIGNFTPPTFTQTTATKSYLTVSVELPKPEYTGTKEITCQFRVDENYEIYKKMSEQKAVTSVSNIGKVNVDVPDETNGGFRVDVYAYDGKGTIGDDSSNFKPLYTFTHCWIKSLKGLSYTYGSSTPLTAEVTIAFQKFEDPEVTISSFVGTVS